MSIVLGFLFEVGEVQQNHGPQEEGPLFRGGVTRENHGEVVRVGQHALVTPGVLLMEHAQLVLVLVSDLELDVLTLVEGTAGTHDAQLADRAGQDVDDLLVAVQDLHLQVHALVGVPDLAQEGPVAPFGQEEGHGGPVETVAGAGVLSLEEEGRGVVVAHPALVVVFHEHFERSGVSSHALFGETGALFLALE